MTWRGVTLYDVSCGHCDYLMLYPYLRKFNCRFDIDLVMQSLPNESFLIFKQNHHKILVLILHVAKEFPNQINVKIAKIQKITRRIPTLKSYPGLSD